MIKNNVYYEFFASYTVPNSDEVGYWVDLGANSKGKIIKVYNQNTKQWVKVTDATSEDAVSPFIGSNGNWWVDNRDTGIPAAGKNPYIGDNGNWWVYDALANDYIDTGIVAKGRSAYELAVENGFIGGEKEWLESLKEPAKQAAEEALKAAEEANVAADRIESSAELAEQAVKDAQQAVADAEEVTTNPPKIVDGYWYAYNFETKEYENTNIRANGKSFKIAKTYTSVAAMEADYNTADVEVGEFVWINTGNVEDPDDSKLYLKGETTWELVGDLSGQQGIEGQSAYEIAVQHGFSGTEEEWLQSLKQPALDAAQEALDAKTQVESTEQAIQEAEESRVSAESARVTAENTRIASEGIRESNEAARQSNEAIREQQEADRQTNTEAAINAAETAANAANQAATEANTQADRAEEYADNPPKIETNYWYLWDETTHAYVNTNIPATGEPGKTPIIQDGTWWVYDNELGEYTNTGISVSSSYVLTKESVENVLTGNITSHTHDQYLTDAPSDGNQYVRQDGNWAAVDIPEVDLSNYLSKDNTVEFTPDSDYEPATKKYVDDSINSIEYTLPTASADTLGGIKVGAGLAINSETGVLSATGGGVADSVDWANITSKPTFATVATSGSYNDLTDKPTIPDLSEVNDAVAANTEAIQANTTAIQSKVDKVEGKQLSTEDYTTEEKTKLSGIAAGAEVNVNADWNATEGDARILNKPDLTKANNLPTWVFDASNLSTEEGDDYITVHGNKKNLETGETSGIGSTIHIATSEHIGYMSPADKTKLDELAANSITSTEVDQKINSAIASVYRVKGSVANYESLPTTGVVIGDVWNLEDTGANYVATSTTPTWDKLSETVDLNGYLTKAEASNTYQPKGNYITSIPEEYITSTELEDYDYATSTDVDELKQNVLTKNNTTAYSPTSDYHPATKKYIDGNMVNVVRDAAYVHTDNNYTGAEKTKLGKLNLVPTLDHEPGESDLTFSDSSGLHDFQIGDLARVADEESEQGYAFYQLYDITSDGKAVWAKSGTGGGVSVLTEKLVLTLTSNQAQPDASLNGLVVHVKYGDNDTPLTWNGTALTTEIPMDMTYQIEYPTLAGYATPETEEYIAMAGNTRTIEASYNATILTINIDSNQTDKTDLNNVQITLSGSISKILDYEGSALTLKVPTGKTVTITPSQLDGYATVSAVEKTPEAATESVNFTYNTTIMSITLSSNQGTDEALNTGTGVTIQCGTVNKQLTWTGTVLKEKLPTGQAYTITPSALEGYKTPDAKSGTANGASMSETLLYQTEVVTVTVNADNSANVSGQQVTINSQQYSYSGSPISVKIPFGTSYSVSVNAKSGYTTPSEQQFTASQSTRSVTMTYLEIKRGIFILDTDGNLVKRTEWNTGNNSKAVGVAVLSDNCKFVIAPEQNGSTQVWSKGGAYDNISGVTTTINSTTAKADYQGVSNSQAIVTKYGNSTDYAAGWCQNYTFKNGKKGYLGSCGEWQEAYNNKSEIDACMSLIGGTAINTSAYHWTSTQHGSNFAWLLYWSDVYVGYSLKTASHRVRAFAAL